MIINHNLNAMNAHRNMGFNTAQTGKAMEKLSSGLRINRAGDDAAGLAISEKMRGQIRGLDQATRNSQDGISLIQTAEGALNETHSILQRMRELAVQSSNDTNVTSDRKAIQDELNELVKEVDRISTTTEFNTQKLLDGSFGGKFQIGANESQSLNLSINKMNSASLGLSTSVVLETNVNTSGTLKDGSYTLKTGNLVDSQGQIVGESGATANIINDGAGDVAITFANSLADGSTVEIVGGKATVKTPLSGDALKLSAGEYEISGTNFIKDGKIVGTFAAGNISFEGSTIDIAELGGSVALATGKKFTVNGADVSTRDKAEGTITAVNKALETVSSERSKLGAVQNRLEHTINNLSTSAENLQAAESRIRDVDMAKEMMNFTKNNILNQAAQAMLSQANQQPQAVLQLLR